VHGVLATSNDTHTVSGKKTYERSLHKNKHT
jgi:hypothetical protein